MVGEFASIIIQGATACALLIPSLALIVVHLTRVAGDAVLGFLESMLNLCFAWGARLDAWLTSAWAQIKAASARRKAKPEPEAGDQSANQTGAFGNMPDDSGGGQGNSAEGVVDIQDYAQSRNEANVREQPPTSSTSVRESNSKPSQKPGQNQTANMEQQAPDNVPDIDGQEGQACPDPGFNPYGQFGQERRT